MDLEEIILYFCSRYPLPHELSKARLTKMIYLADWYSCLRNGRQLSNIQWYFHNFGPYVDDVVDAARLSGNLELIEQENIYGDTKVLIRLVDHAIMPHVDRNSQAILDHVINETKGLYWNEFIKHVYATKPIANSTRYTSLDLVRFAKS